MAQIFDFFDARRQKLHAKDIEDGPTTIILRFHEEQITPQNIDDAIDIRKDMARYLSEFLLKQGFFKEERYALSPEYSRKGIYGVEMRITLYKGD